MIDRQKYVIRSLELHLFFMRIMKEHALFLEAGFTPANADMARVADDYKTNFERLLASAVKLSDGVLRQEVLRSGEFITDYTLGTEEKTERFTNISIDQDITRAEKRLHSGENPNITPELVEDIEKLNEETLDWLNGLIDFKKRILNGMRSCELFTMNYPLLIDHILREANLYRSHIMALQNGQDNENYNLQKTEIFWDQIMMEHAMFIRGLLDPSEDALINTADTFSEEFKKLLAHAKSATAQTFEGITEETLKEVRELKEFKEAGTKGIASCKIQSIILPLLADHVLREANHYIRLLNNMKNK